MQAIEFDAEIRDGTISLPNELRHWSDRTVHVIVLEKDAPSTETKARRTPHPRIAGKGRSIGDLVAPAVGEADWECLK